MEYKNFLLGFCFSFVLILLLGSYFEYLDFGQKYCLNNAEAVFSPGSEDEIVSLIEGAENSIELQMYVFTNERLALALARASERGVRVRVILEGRVDSYNLDKIVDALQSSGVQVRWGSLDYKLTHSKFMVIDGEKVFVGSTNFSNSAVGKNREAAVILDGGIVDEFEDKFEVDWEIAKIVG